MTGDPEVIRDPASHEPAGKLTCIKGLINRHPQMIEA